MNADLPPEPERRTITPAPQDYEHRPPPHAFLWPLGWIALAVVLWALVG